MRGSTTKLGRRENVGGVVASKLVDELGVVRQVPVKNRIPRSAGGVVDFSGVARVRARGIVVGAGLVSREGGT